MPTEDPTTEPTFTTEELMLLHDALAVAQVQVAGAALAVSLLAKLRGMIESKNVAEV